MKSQRGFTLTEFLCAITMLAFCLLALVRMAITTMSTNTWGSDNVIATRLAQNKIAQLKSGGYAALTISSNPYSDANNPIDPLGNSGGYYTRTWTIASGPTTGTKTITVTITWRGGAKQTSISTLMANPGS